MVLLAKSRRVAIELQQADRLTGLLNRRAILQKAGEEWQRYRRLGRPCACLLIAVDDLGRINRSLGEEAGDHVLKALARMLRVGLSGKEAGISSDLARGLNPASRAPGPK